MRRLTSIALTVVLVGLASGLTASATSTANIKDKYTSIGWGGSDGSLPWSGSWQENGDDGDEKFGNVRVVSSGNCASGNCMQFGALTTLLSGPIGVTRRADTSALGELQLCFDIKATGSLLGSQLTVQVRGESGGWVTVKQYALETALTDHPTIDISDFSSDDFRIRFVFSSPLLGSEVYIDNVEILGVYEGETTTTTVVSETTTTNAETTTVPQTTTTTQPRSTTTTIADATTSSSSTTVPATPSTLLAPDRTPGPAGFVPTTSTTGPSGGDVEGDAPDAGGAVSGPEGSGIRAAARGVQANFQGDLYGEIRTVSSVSGVDLQADYNMAVEVIRASWAWMILLGLVIGWAIVTGLERRRDELDG